MPAGPRRGTTRIPPRPPVSRSPFARRQTAAARAPATAASPCRRRPKESCPAWFLRCSTDAPIWVVWAAARRLQCVALVGPLVLRGIAASDAFERRVERADRHYGVGIADVFWRGLDVQGERRIVVAPII